ncbi:hypothetical protein SAMN06295905_2506 [Devosia lucknowensis]|uniref:Uncharacterized protein n=1 Tax=Devosia lucknowensis TaxID=1096929 RepID=A0A1Y6FT06_9HYPH|nr:hypothetical protein [Devosia lucknowensis]SMQ76012.1 hypothetical protein SAMN06295905_2506 [Devosia lucknowensis]
MAILSLRPRAFRSRNAGRDAETDAARIETVRNAITMALNDARRERDGLQGRIDLYHAQAASIMDHSGDYGWRDRADETAIGSAESKAANGRRRIAQLNDQIERFEKLIADLENPYSQAQDAGVASA